MAPIANMSLARDPSTPGERDGVLRAVGLGLITGAADDDPSAIGTYAAAGAKFGPALLWTAPLTFPMMFTVVYLSSKLGQVAGQGLFELVRRHYSKWILYPALCVVVIGNTIEAGANIGGMAAALHLVAPLPISLIVVGTTAAILALQIWGSYRAIRNVFRWLALALLGYAAAAFFAKPDWPAVVRGTFVPTLRFDRDSLAMLVAVVGTTLSAYLYTWQSNQEVEEEIAKGRRTLEERRGATEAELRTSRVDIFWGMLFSNVVMYFIMLSTGATLHRAGQTDIETAAEAADALRPLAGDVAGILFALGVVAVGFLAIPVMTAGAAYDLTQAFGLRHGLHAKPRDAKRFYAIIVSITAVAMGMNFFGLNPMKALVVSGIVQGFSTPPLLLLLMLMTNSRAIMGNRVNGPMLNLFGWITVGAVSATTIGLVASWILA